MSTATIQRKDINDSILNALFALNIVFGLTLMLAVSAVSPLANQFFGDNRVGPLVVVASLAIPIGALSAQHRALMTREMQWEKIYGISVLCNLGGLLLGVLCVVWLNFGYWALIVPPIAIAVLETVGFWCVCRWRPTQQFDWTSASSAINFGLHLSGFQLVNYFHRQADNVLIGYRWGAVELGYYTRAYALFTMPLTIINGPIGAALLPSLSRLQDDPPQWRRIFLDALAVVSLLSSLMGTLLLLLAEPLVLLVLGPAWSSTTSIFQFLSVSILIQAPMSAMGWIFLSRGRTDRMFAWSIFATSVIVIAYLVGIENGAKGVAIAYSVAIYCLAPLLFWFAARDTPVTFFQLLAVVLPAIIVGLLAVAIVTLTTGVNTAARQFDWPLLQHALISLAIAGGLHLALSAAVLRWLPAYRGLKHSIIKALPWRQAGAVDVVE